MRISATSLRADVYRVIDQVLDTGEPVEIERRGRVVRLVAVGGPSKLDRLVRRGVVTGDSADLAEIGWAGAWSPDDAVDTVP